MRESKLNCVTPLSSCTHIFSVTHVHLHTGRHVRTPKYTPTYLTHMYTPVACPTQRSLICVWLLSCVLPCLCWLAERPRKPYRRRHQRRSAPTWPACLSYFQPPPPGLRMQPGARRKKAEDPDSYLLLALDHVLSGSGKSPPEVFKSVRPLKTTTWSWTPELCLKGDSKELLFLIRFNTKGHWCFRMLCIVMLLAVQLTQHLFCWTNVESL